MPKTKMIKRSNYYRNHGDVMGAKCWEYSNIHPLANMKYLSYLQLEWTIKVQTVRIKKDKMRQ